MKPPRIPTPIPIQVMQRPLSQPISSRHRQNRHSPRGRRTPRCCHSRRRRSIWTREIHCIIRSRAAFIAGGHTPGLGEDTSATTLERNGLLQDTIRRGTVRDCRTSGASGLGDGDASISSFGAGDGRGVCGRGAGCGAGGWAGGEVGFVGGAAASMAACRAGSVLGCGWDDGGAATWHINHGEEDASWGCT